MNIPTGRDIYLEADGKRVAVVQSYQATTTKESRTVEAFGEVEPVATVPGKVNHHITLKKVVPLRRGVQDPDFHTLSNFTLMIVKPDCRIVYTGCEWLRIDEQGDVNRPCLEEVSLVAAKRLVL